MNLELLVGDSHNCLSTRKTMGLLKILDYYYMLCWGISKSVCYDAATGKKRFKSERIWVMSNLRQRRSQRWQYKRHARLQCGLDLKFPLNTIIQLFSTFVKKRI